jgi:hypothetical protein
MPIWSMRGYQTCYEIPPLRFLLESYFEGGSTKCDLIFGDRVSTHGTVPKKMTTTPSTWSFFNH